MKAFEKWAEQHISPEAEHRITVAAYDAWRAALEHLRDDGYCVGTGHGHECGYEEIIEKELEN